VRRDELRLALPAGHPLAARREIGPESLQADELILLEDGHCLTEHALTACRIGPGPGESGFSATSLTTLVQMVGGGLGISFLPAMAVEAGLAEAAGIAVRPLAMADASRQIVVAWRAGSRRAAEGRLLAEAFASLSRADEARAMGAANDRPVREDERPRQRLRRDRGGRRGPLGGPRAGAGGP
jgi:LysR family hydrogen peroxide-inducible transcriptional activator